MRAKQCLKCENIVNGTQFLYLAICTQRTHEGTRVILGFIEHGIYIRQCQDLNSQPVLPQVRADFHLGHSDR